MFRITQSVSVLANGRLARVTNFPHTRSAMVHTTAPTQQPANTKHTSDSYSKDEDDSPPADPSVHRVDPGSESVQKPHEPPSGEWSRTGVQAGHPSADDAYRTTEGKKQPYAPKGGNKGRYGSRMGWAEEKSKETSGSEEGPEGKASGGRKAE